MADGTLKAIAQEAVVSMTAQRPGQMPEAGKPGPDNPSADYNLMKPLWDKVDAMSGGADSMKAAAKKYLPKFELESTGDYETRIKTSPFTNVYEDIAANLAGKPFAREVQFEDSDEVDEVFTELFENIDGQGNNLHVFAEQTFRDGIDRAIDWILIDYTKVPAAPEGRSRTVAEEEALGARPYWVHVAANRVKAVHSDMVRGRMVITHLRIDEPTTERDGYGEKTFERVRIFNREPFKDDDGQTDYEPATWDLQEKRRDKNGQDIWVSIDSGVIPIEIIPMVPFFIGKRIGNGWAVKAPMQNVVDLQFDAFQQETNIRNLELLSCYPMLSGNGIAPPQQPAPGVGDVAPKVQVPVGPRAVLWAPPGPGGEVGSWSFLEPSGESLKQLQSRLEKHWDNMREIGMQPLSEANITVITSANLSVKAKSMLQAWTLRLKDTLEQAFVITALWLGKDKEEAPGVDVYKDFGVDLQAGKDTDSLLDANEKAIISKETVREEFKRRNILGDSFDEEQEKERLANEAAEAAEAEGVGPDGQPLEEEDEGPVEEPIDPDNIDDKALRRLYGDDVVDAAA